MRAEDLQIGDWITARKWREKSFQVTRINEANKFFYGKTGDTHVGPFLIEELEPIPLTPEILEKNTSESNKNVFGGMNYALNADYFIENRGDRFCFSRRMAGHKYSTFWVCDIHYVHDLQHLIKLVGIDKEIQI